MCAQGRRRRREAIAQAAQDCCQQLQLYLPGSQLFGSSEATSSALQRHLVRTLAQPLLDWLIRYQVRTKLLIVLTSDINPHQVADERLHKPQSLGCEIRCECKLTHSGCFCGLVNVLAHQCLWSDTKSRSLAGRCGATSLHTSTGDCSPVMPSLMFESCHLACSGQLKPVGALEYSHTWCCPSMVPG